MQANVHEASKKARETAESAARQRLERALSTLTRQLETKAMLTANQALEEWQAEVGALQQEGAKLVSTHTKELAALREEHAESQQSLQSESISKREALREVRKVHVDYQKQLAEQDEAAQAARDEIEGQLRARHRTSLEEAAQEASGRLAKELVPAEHADGRRLQACPAFRRSSRWWQVAESALSQHH